MKRGKNRSAQASIITTVLIIMLVLVAIVIVYNVVKRTVVTGTESIGTGQFTVQLEIENVVLPIIGEQRLVFIEVLVEALLMK
tara:strand:+ start:1390 stop:1638 length:249 start_codon:yes stop_codon:yes gene_type:complete